MVCPKCNSPRYRLAWNLRNLFAIVGNLLGYALQLLITLGEGDLFHEGWEFTRKCRDCGHRFLTPAPQRRNFDECRNCQYDLTGNASGRCPECGWKLPRRYRAHRRKVDRKEHKLETPEQRQDYGS